MMRQDWVSLASNPTVEALLNTLVELQERVVRLEADMVLLKSTNPDTWAIDIHVPADTWDSIRQETQ
jgi:hypothetical protein